MVKKYNIKEKFNIYNSKTAENAVCYALKGYTDPLGDSYEGLIPEDTYAAIAKQHNKDSNARVGKYLHQTNRGIHAQNPKERKAVGKAGALAMGYRVFSEEEETFIKNLKLEEYRKGKYKEKIRLDLEKITRELNEKFHQEDQGRTVDAVGQFFRKIKNPAAPIS